MLTAYSYPAANDRWCGAAVAPLEGFEAHEWVCFERALVVRDLFTGGVRTFFSTADAQHFRARLYQHYGTLAAMFELPKSLLCHHSS